MSGCDKKHGGCLKLFNIRLSKFHYCDISIIISSTHITKSQWEVLHKWHVHCQSEHFDKIADPETNCLEAANIEKSLTGIARIIYFRKYQTSDNFYLTDMMEGEMSQGSFDGYARCLEVRFNQCKASAVNISCKVGFWKTQDGCLMPNGKWAWFLTNSHYETKMRA